MRNRIIQKWAALATACLLLIGLAACGGSPAQTDEAPAQEPNASTEIGTRLNSSHD